MVSDQATTEPAPEPRPGPTGMPLRLRPLDEVGDDQEVARILHPLDDAELVVEPLAIVRLVEAGRDAVRGEPAGQAGSRLDAEELRLGGFGSARIGRPAPAKRGRIGFRHAARMRSAGRSRRCCRAPRAGRRSSAIISARVLK